MISPDCEISSRCMACHATHPKDIQSCLNLLHMGDISKLGDIIQACLNCLIHGRCQPVMQIIAPPGRYLQTGRYHPSASWWKISSYPKFSPPGWYLQTEQLPLPPPSADSSWASGRGWKQPFKCWHHKNHLRSYSTGTHSQVPRGFPVPCFAFCLGCGPTSSPVSLLLGLRCSILTWSQTTASCCFPTLISQLAGQPGYSLHWNGIALISRFWPLHKSNHYNHYDDIVEIILFGD